MSGKNNIFHLPRSRRLNIDGASTKSSLFARKQYAHGDALKTITQQLPYAAITFWESVNGHAPRSVQHTTLTLLEEYIACARMHFDRADQQGESHD